MLHETILFSIVACVLFIIVGIGATDILSSDCSVVSFEALFMICKDLSLFKSASILSIHLELVLVLLVVYTIYVSFIVQW